MKKTLLAALVLMFGFALQAQAVGTNSNQGGAKPEQADVVAPGNPVGNAVGTQEQNQVMNQGENTQIQTQEKNAVETQDGAKTPKGIAGSSVQKRSQVANAVQAMLQIADRNEGIGKQVRTIAQNQNQNRDKLEKNIEKIQSRGGFAKFFVGPNYGEIKDAQKTLEQNREQIRQLNQVRTQLSNQGDQQQLTEQIMILEQANQEIKTLLDGAQGGFSLFGWLNKLVS
ncbi:MAG: hypothetical protein U0944_01145 [Candidatus Moranbacteria bacterium]|nr:hypothetical protein [Candidatus Moranbacteria bacterium]MDZ4385004.1 hypothetical protein [Candidatus Moranbacteria bacterium]